VDYMARALELASRARGRTSPNPMVGAVLVKDGRIVGEGFHHRAGGPHAEQWSLREAGEEARGAKLYINLEPCCHHGRTPPCTEALIEAGVSEVHMAMEDPNPLVHGKGRRALHSAGIRTFVGDHEDEARQLNEVFIKYITSGRPFVTAKFAMSLDGKIATSTGESRWISGERARKRVHELRDTNDAICVGVNTLLADDPRLTTRLDRVDVCHPLRVILDSRGRSPLTSRAFDPNLPGRTAVATTDAMPVSHRTGLSDRGVEVWVLPSDAEGRVSLSDLLNRLGSSELTSLLVEGGGSVLASFVEKRLVDKVLVFVAPLIIGGQDAPTPVRGIGAAYLGDAMRLERLSVEQVGEDMLLVAYPSANMLMSDS
jgi:diaminohydroxyphosphoribosylaminopyrimidine deaminase/5-amino-6-(5-phosphoribosylamino)uracil reductase